jgi:hypothetical protein
MLQGGNQNVLTVLFCHTPPAGAQYVDCRNQSTATELFGELPAL